MVTSCVKMKTINVNKSVNGVYSSVDGYTLYCILRPYFISNQTVTVSFKDIPLMSSSFFNSSFGELIDEFGISSFKEIIKIVDITNSQAKFFRRYLEMHIQ